MGKFLVTWLSLVMSMMVSFVLSFFPRGVLDEILNLIESVSEGFPSYSFLSLPLLIHSYLPISNLPVSQKIGLSARSPV